MADHLTVKDILTGWNLSEAIVAEFEDAEFNTNDLRDLEPDNSTWTTVATDLWTPKEKLKYTKGWKAKFSRRTPRSSVARPLFSSDGSTPTRALSQASSDTLQGITLREVQLSEGSDDNGDEYIQSDDPQVASYNKIDKGALVDDLEKVRQILESSEKGKSCVQLASVHRSRAINSSDRKLIADVIIYYLHREACKGANVIPHFSYTELHQIALQLARYFRDTTSLWFHLASPRKVHSKSTGSDSTPTRVTRRKYPYGHLWSKVNNLKEIWRKKNPELYKKIKESSAKKTIEARKRKAARPRKASKKVKPAPSPPPPQRTLEDREQELLGHPFIQTIRKVDWYKQDPISKDVEEALSKTAKIRHDYLCSEGATLEHYLDLFRFFQSHQTAKLVVEFDFHEIYNVPEGKLYQRLSELHPAIVSEARASKGIRGRETFVESILNFYDNNSEPDKKITAALVALPYAIGTQRVKKVADQRAPTQISKKESADHFVTFVQTESEGAELHSQRRQAFQGTLQPYVIAIGKLGSVSHCFVKYLDLSIKTDTVVQAVDLCFKLIFVFNCEYPPQCRHVWQTLELVCYDLKVSTNFLHSAQTLASTCAQFLDSRVEVPAVTGASSDDEHLVTVAVIGSQIVGDQCICSAVSPTSGEIITFVDLKGCTVSGIVAETQQPVIYGTCTKAFATEHQSTTVTIEDDAVVQAEYHIISYLS